MHLLRLFFTAWLEVGIVTTLFLFWLCKRTAQRTEKLDKPVLDQAAFQQLLAAASTLQAQNNRKLGKEAQADSSPTVSPLEPVRMTQSDLESPASLNDSAVPNYPGWRIARSDDAFWKAATAIAMVAVSAMLLFASLDRLSPLPRGLEVVQQEVPFHRALPQGGAVAPGTSMMEPEATETERPDVAETPPGSATSGSSHKIGNPKRHSAYESEADVVARDTVVRYSGRRSR
jgi:hypothetical protein